MVFFSYRKTNNNIEGMGDTLTYVSLRGHQLLPASGWGCWTLHGLATIERERKIIDQ